MNAPIKPKGGTRAAKPKLVSNKASAQKPDTKAAVLLRLEGEARRQTTEAELCYHLANPTRQVLPFRHAFVIRMRGSRPRLQTVSSVAAVERDAPMTRWLERMLRKASAARDMTGQFDFVIDDFSDDKDPEQASYPFRQMLWTPLKTARGKVFAGLLTAREGTWDENDRTIAMRLADTYSHAWRALVGERRAHKSGLRLGRILWPAALAGIVAAGFIPVPMTAVAPMVVAPVKTTVIAAGLSGVVDEVLVEPAAVVSQGDLLFRYNEDEVLNAYHVAERQVAVAEARALRARQAAVASAEAKAEVAVAMAELEVARAERDYARERTEKLLVRAPVDGVAVFADRSEWTGRPVQVGERIMEVADPAAALYEVELAVDDAIVLQQGARVRAFLDTDPLNAQEAVLDRGAYRASPTEDGRLVYRLIATPDGAAAPRIGTRGSAQVYGAEVPLALFLFRRPISALRQQFGL